MSNEKDQTTENAEFDALVKDIESDKVIRWEPDKPMIRAGDAAKRRRQMSFLKAFGETGTIGKACQLAGINRATEIAWRNNDQWYIQRFQEAVQLHRDTYQDFVRDWAFNGAPTPIKLRKTVQVGKDTDGNPIFASEEVIEYANRPSELMAMFYGKRIDPAWKDNYKPEEQDRKSETASPLARIVIDIEERANRKIINVTPEKQPEAAKNDGTTS